MNALPSPVLHVLLAAFLLFCRIGACLMIAPGIGASQIPTQIRLFVVLGTTLGLTPMMLDRVVGAVDETEPLQMFRLVAAELVTGGLIGALARLFFSALETMSFAAATMLGLANPFGVEIEQNQPSPPLATLIALGATAMVFVANLHAEIAIGVIDSYRAVPLGAAFDPRHGLVDVTDALSQSFLVAIRIASPFLLYAAIVNFALALINRVTPQIAVFFIAPPFIVFGGLALTFLTIRGQISQFVAAFSAWLAVS